MRSLNLLYNKDYRIALSTGYLLLTVPFVIVLLYTGGLAGGLDTVFSVDEPKYHYPTILNFAKRLPFPDIRDYGSATTPLFHILLAALSKIVGTDIQHLRLANFFITYFSVLFLFSLLCRQYKLKPQVSLLFTFIFALSPYYFREAFVILTDNLPVLWLLFFFNFYFRYKAEHKQSLLLLSLLFVMLLCLTRQTYLFVCLAIAMDTMLIKEPLQTKMKILSLVFVAATPTLALFFIWKGLTPPSFREFHTRESLINAKAVLYGFCVLGFYTLFIPGTGVFKSLLQKRKIMIAVVILLSWSVLFFSPLIKNPKDFGYLWYMASPLPRIAGTSLLFWGLLPLGVITVLCIWHKEGLNLFILFLVCLFLSEVPNKLIFQRYYDSSVILILILFSAKYHESNKIDYYRRLLLVAFFITYFVVFTIA